MAYENDIVQDSYYLISLFNKDNKEITQLQIQKIMYFFEAYYMLVHNADKLYECNFNAWAFGPVAIPLYNEFKAFGENNIILNEMQKDKVNNISTDKKNLIDNIYKAFGNLSAIRLVELTHKEGSPWSIKWKENGEKIVYGSKSYINKIETRDWFEKNFVKDK